MKIPTTVFLTAIFLFLCSFSQPAKTQQLQLPNLSNQNPPTQQGRRNGTATIEVHAMDGTPIPDAEIELRDLHGRWVSAGQTNTRGNSEFRDLPMGTYEAIATRKLDRAQVRFNLDGNMVIVELHLPILTDSAAGDSRPSISIAEYRVPKKARQALIKAQDAAEKNNLRDIRRYLQEALTIYPDFAEALTFRGLIELDNNDAEAARSDMEKAIACDPKYPTAHLVLGSAYILLGRYDDAIRSIQSGLRLAPNSWQGHLELGKAYYGKRDYPAALAELAVAGQWTPKDYAPIHWIKANLLLESKDYSAAMAELELFLTLAPRSTVESEKAQTLLQQAKALLADRK